jgi:tetratricopeptide (TPR) repeat protein
VALQAGSSSSSRAEARAHLDKAIQIAPDYDLAHEALAEALLADHDLSRALDHASRAVSLAPSWGPHRLTLARVLVAVEQIGDAQSEARKAMELGLNDSQNKAALALLEPAATDGAPIPRFATAPVGRSVAWGVFVDEDGQSRIEATGDRVEITAPAGAYDLSPEIGNTNAPRLMRAVEGDFVALVTVSKAPQPAPIHGSANRVPFNGAGLLLWLDAKNFVRLEFATSTTTGGGANRYALFELRRNGVAVGGLPRPRTHLDDAAASLKLERHARTLVASVRQGEGEWTPVGHLEMDLPPEVYLGIAAVNTTQAPFAAAFEDFTVSPAP